ncbi:outer membrane efflux protein [Ahrensia sp. R2A130]|nr:outer membrane efflux protein [Ahrensia sp. R2A130]
MVYYTGHLSPYPDCSGTTNIGLAQAFEKGRFLPSAFWRCLRIGNSGKSDALEADWRRSGTPKGTHP